ncbi:MAG: hypothetical protein ACE5J5_08570, partial [Candidatus Hydrothermarchaeales archaeon]
MQLEAKGYKKKQRSPFYLLITLIISIFTAEIVVMFFLSRISGLSLLTEALIDGLVLVIIVFPFIFYLVFRPTMLYITERKEAEETLKKSEKKYRELFDSS